MTVRRNDVYRDPFGTFWLVIGYFTDRGRGLFEVRSLNMPGGRQQRRQVRAITLYREYFYTRVGRNYKRVYHENHQPI